MPIMMNGLDLEFQAEMLDLEEWEQATDFETSWYESGAAYEWDSDYEWDVERAYFAYLLDLKRRNMWAQVIRVLRWDGAMAYELKEYPLQ